MDMPSLDVALTWTKSPPLAKPARVEITPAMEAYLAWLDGPRDDWAPILSGEELDGLLTASYIERRDGRHFTTEAGRARLRDDTA